MVLGLPSQVKLLQMNCSDVYTARLFNKVQTVLVRSLVQLYAANSQLAQLRGGEWGGASGEELVRKGEGSGVSGVSGVRRVEGGGGEEWCELTHCKRRKQFVLLVRGSGVRRAEGHHATRSR